MLSRVWSVKETCRFKKQDGTHEPERKHVLENKHPSNTLVLDTFVGHSGASLLWDTLVGHSCGVLLQNTLVGLSSGTLL